MYDLLIQNGLVIDGTGKPAFPADVAVSGDRIAKIAPKIEEEAKKVYDAKGKYVIPGLIDPHVHEEWVCMIDGRYPFFLKEGVTTVVNGNCGHSVIPGDVNHIMDYYLGNGLLSLKQWEEYKKTFPRWHDFESYAQAAEEKGTNLNFVTLMGHGTIRWSVMNGAHPRKPTEEEHAKIESIVKNGMDQGMFGISFGLDYVPSRYADIEELCDVVNMVKAYDGVAAAHQRNAIGIYEATQEFLEVGRRTGAKIQISHLASDTPEAFEAARKAHDEEGVRVHIDTIPDSTGHCISKSRMFLFIMALSDELFSQGVEGVKKALADPEGRAMIIRECYIFAGNKGSKYVVHSDDPHLENRSVLDIARERGVDPDECMLDLIADDNNYVFWVNAPAAHVPSKFIDHCPSIVENPYVSVGSDEIFGDPADPFDWYEVRRRGSFIIFANRYLKKGVPYEEIVRRNTSLVADHFGIEKRGRLQEGNFADIAVIDLEHYYYPEVSQEQYKTPELTGEGCEFLVVNGQVELEDGQVLRTYAGRVLRKNRQN
ncbi:amidohydrolase family protein [Cuneatibacter sp. NSJ-177]|uniref:N-acyl-D-amino-acid deacylase family protein n=1 Tax=Cuneatibacter sp. NSJ-177 TaxID=2931401 RepID=UPI001FD03616|nr:amidohydrolase family protein [Cuneatibacter sp. NSJ-177]MCJ7836622.1 amidohydrolase family protein [Cuneatibacter sp. NSJ-177]